MNNKQTFTYLLNRYFSNEQNGYKRSDLMDNFDKYITNIELELLPSAKSFLDLIDVSKTISVKDLDSIKALQINIGMSKYKKTYQFIKSGLVPTLEYLLINKSKLNTLIKQHLSVVLYKNKATAKDLIILNLLDNIALIVDFAPKFFYFIIGDIRQNKDLTDDRFTKKEIDTMKNTLGTFVNVIDTMDKKYLDNFFASVPKTTTVKASDIINTDDSAVNIVLGDKSGPSAITTHNFHYNIFYWIGRQIVDYQHSRAEKDKAEAQRLRLEIIRLQSEMNGVNDQKINNQIDYFKNKLDETEYRLSKYMEKENE